MKELSEKSQDTAFGDIMAIIDEPERKDLLLKEDLYRYINNYNGDIEKFLDSIKDKYTYIEAQVWSDLYLNETIILSKRG